MDESIKIIKDKRDYNKSLRKAFLENFFFSGLIVICFCYWAYKLYPYKLSLIIILLSSCIIFILQAIYLSFKRTRYHVIEIKLWKDKFELKYLNKDEINEFIVNDEDQLRIDLNYQDRGFYPFKDFDRVTSISIENVTQKKQIFIEPTNGWTSKELYHLFYDRFKKNEYYYRLKNINTKFGD